jgi:hypothetical protein
MKQIDYMMRVKYSDNSQVWNEDNSVIVSDHITIRQHAQQLIDKWNRHLKPKEKKKVLVMVRNLPKKYIKPIPS